MARTPKSPASTPAARKPRATTARSRTAKPTGAAPAAKTAAKPVAKRAPRAVKPAPVAEATAAPEAAPVPEAPREAAEAPALIAVAVPQLRKKELVERVATLSGVRKKDVKAVVEATLSVLGAALAAGEELNLPPLGKARINRQKDGTKGATMMIRLRRNSGEESAKQPLAEPAD